MGSAFVIDPERRLVSVRMWGKLTRAEIHDVAIRIAADPALGKDFSELIDLRELTSSAAITTEDLRTLASSPLDPVARRAFVVAEAATFGLARMFQVHRSLGRAKEQIGVFKTIEEAQAWLGAA